MVPSHTGLSSSKQGLQEPSLTSPVGALSIEISNTFDDFAFELVGTRR